MSWRVRNKNSGNFISKDMLCSKARDLADQLNRTSSDAIYEAVDISAVKRAEIPDNTREMTEDEISAIESFKKVKVAPGVNHDVFLNTLMDTAAKNKKLISEKQAAYLWHLVHRYRRQINNRGLVALAERNKVY